LIIGKREEETKLIQNPICGNKGYSLVEMVVVISIITIMVGVISTGISLMFSKDAESAAIIIDDALSRTRMLSMSQNGTFEMTIFCDKDGNYKGDNKNYIVIKTTDLSSSDPGYVEEIINFKTKAYIGKNTSSFPQTNNTTIAIAFSKSNGSVVNIDGPVSTADIVEINCQAVKNSSKTAKVKLMTVSGRHVVEK